MSIIKIAINWKAIGSVGIGMGVGGAAGVLTAKPGERLKRGVIGGAIGGIAGGGAIAIANKLKSSKVKPNNIKPESPDETFVDDQISEAVKKFQKKKRAATARRESILHNSPGEPRLTERLEKIYGREYGVPYLDLEIEQPRVHIERWMKKRNMPFDPNKPSVQQLEQALEAQIDNRVQSHVKRMKLKDQLRARKQK